MGRGARPDRGECAAALSKPLRTEAEADREFEEAIRRYEGQRRGLGAELLAAVDEVLERIVHLPSAGVLPGPVTLTDAAQKGWITLPARHPPQGPPPRIPTAPWDELSRELDEDRSER